MATYLLAEGTLQFELQDEIGNGGEGEVFRAFDSQLNAWMAVKRVPRTLFTSFDEFFEEARKLYVTRHHNVVQVNYACRDDDFIYLSMPFYQNGSMRGVTNHRFLTSREIIRYSLQFLSGVNNVHSKSLVHFDIKTENILISDSNQALISDFGLAQYTGHYGFAENFGTTQVFAPPELFDYSIHNLKFDIYQAGLAMYRMCNGDAEVFKQIHEAHEIKGSHDRANFIQNLKNGNFPNRSKYLPHIPISLKNVINKALKVNPNERYSSIIDMLNDLSKITAANDWVYSIDASGMETWQLDDYHVTANPVGGEWDIAARKGARRATKYTKKVSKLSEKNSLLYNCLNGAW